MAVCPGTLEVRVVQVVRSVIVVQEDVKERQAPAPAQQDYGEQRGLGPDQPAAEHRRQYIRTGDQEPIDGLVRVRRNSIVLVHADPVVSLTRLSSRINMDHRAREKRQVMPELVLDRLGYLMPLGNAEVRCH